jgi:antitoxin HicB
MRYAYPIEILEAPDGVTINCPDVPEMVTCGDTRAEALERAADALISALSFYTDEGKPLPRPSPARGRPMISVTMLEAAKLALHDAMLAEKISNVELGRRLELDERAVRRLRDPLYRSHIGTVETALRNLGRQIRVDITSAVA